MIVSLGYFNDIIFTLPFFPINPKESKIVKIIFDKYLEYNSLGEVRKFLIKKKMPTRNGNGWNNNTVGAILGRKTYTGCIENGHGDVKCPELRLISTKAFKATQEIRSSRAGLSPALRGKEERIYAGGRLYEELRGVYG